MKTNRLGLHKISKYYRVSGYCTTLERVAKLNNSSIYPYLPQQLKVNNIEGLTLFEIDTSKKLKDTKVEAIEPITKDDYYA